MPEKMYRIAWSTSTWETGNGEYCLSLEVAQDWVNRMKTKYPDMRHWIEEQPSNIPSKSQGSGETAANRTSHLEENPEN